MHESRPRSHPCTVYGVKCLELWAQLRIIHKPTSRLLRAPRNECTRRYHGARSRPYCGRRREKDMLYEHDQPHSRGIVTPLAGASVLVRGDEAAVTPSWSEVGSCTTHNQGLDSTAYSAPGRTVRPRCRMAPFPAHSGDWLIDCERVMERVARTHS